MAIQELYSDTGTSISTTEYSLTNDSTTVAAQTTDALIQCFIDFADMAAGDQYRVRVYEKIVTGGTARTIYDATLTGPQSSPLTIPALIVMHGWDVTVQRLAGSDRSIAWSIRAA